MRTALVHVCIALGVVALVAVMALPAIDKAQEIEFRARETQHLRR